VARRIALDQLRREITLRRRSLVHIHAGDGDRLTRTGSRSGQPVLANCGPPEMRMDGGRADADALADEAERTNTIHR
jgi:hypothetical protein